MCQPNYLDPPLPLDHMEDWVRATTSEGELAARLAALADRARDVVPQAPPLVADDEGILRRGDAWVALPVLEARVFAALSAAGGAIVGRDELTRLAWPAGPPADARAVDGVVKRLRRRLRPLGVEIHTATGRGFLLETPAGSTDAAARRQLGGGASPSGLLR